MILLVLGVAVLHDRHVVDLLELWFLVVLHSKNGVRLRSILGTLLEVLDRHHGGGTHLHLLLMVQRC